MYLDQVNFTDLSIDFYYTIQCINPVNVNAKVEFVISNLITLAKCWQYCDYSNIANVALQG